ncbi:MAG: hypothetical protein AB7F43_06095 [Bacteriovoracia bacterium]
MRKLVLILASFLNLSLAFGGMSTAEQLKKYMECSGYLLDAEVACANLNTCGRLPIEFLEAFEKMDRTHSSSRVKMGDEFDEVGKSIVAPHQELLERLEKDVERFKELGEKIGALREGIEHPDSRDISKILALRSSLSDLRFSYLDRLARMMDRLKEATANYRAKNEKMLKVLNRIELLGTDDAALIAEVEEFFGTHDDLEKAKKVGKNRIAELSGFLEVLSVFPTEQVILTGKEAFNSGMEKTLGEIGDKLEAAARTLKVLLDGELENQAEEADQKRKQREEQDKEQDKEQVQEESSANVAPQALTAKPKPKPNDGSGPLSEEARKRVDQAKKSFAENGADVEKFDATLKKEWADKVPNDPSVYLVGIKIRDLQKLADSSKDDVELLLIKEFNALGASTMWITKETEELLASVSLENAGLVTRHEWVVSVRHLEDSEVVPFAKQ